MTENCTATDDTLLAIGDLGATIRPPPGWKFAKQSEHSVAVGPGGKSLLAAVEISSAEDSVLIASLTQLSAASALEKVKFEALKKRLKKPQITVDASGTPVDLWEVSKATSNGTNPALREGGAGTLLVFVARLAPNRVVTGLGFVVVPDAEADAQKVMQAVQSLKGAP